MTALQLIIKEAKILRKKNPKMEWKKAVAQASAIYASKHKGKSPVGKKKAAPKKKAAKKRKVAGVKASKEIKKVLAKKGLKMPHGYSTTKRVRKVSGVKKKKISEQSILNKIHRVKDDVNKLDMAQHKHMMGKISHHNLDKIKSSLQELKQLETHLSILKNVKPKIVKSQLPVIRREIKNTVNSIKEIKTHIIQLKKHI